MTSFKVSALTLKGKNNLPLFECSPFHREREAEVFCQKKKKSTKTSFRLVLANFHYVCALILKEKKSCTVFLTMNGVLVLYKNENTFGYPFQSLCFTVPNTVYTQHSNIL